MKEELITFETAKLAKEKGFNGKCYKMCDPMGNIIHDTYTDYGVNYNSNEGKHKDMYSLPNQSLLQKWLREKHKIHVVADVNDTLSWVYTIQMLYKAKYKTQVIANNSYKTYEAALEEGLQKALKLIK